MASFSLREVVCFFLIPLGFLSCSDAFQIVSRPNRMVINHGDSTIRFYTIDPKRSVREKSGSMYSWFIGGKIKNSQGSYTGKLLHGKVEIIGPDSGLLENGRYKMGRKRGAWRKWYTTGELFQERYFRKGWIHGVTREFNESGEVQKLTRFSFGKKDGKQKEFLKRSLLAKRKYRKGLLIWEKKFQLEP